MNTEASESDATRTKRFRLVTALARRWPSAIAMFVLATVVGSVILAPWITTGHPDRLDPVNAFQVPEAAHWFGTDNLGRDLFTRDLYGGRLALEITLASTVLAIALGVAWGAASVSRLRWSNEILMRIADVIMAIPQLLVAIILISAVGPSVTALILILGIVFAPGTARIVRAAISAELGKEYCLAARAYGSSNTRIVCREALPNVGPTILAQTSLVAAGVLMVEASLSFIGVGVQPPSATWGSLLREGYSEIYQSYWYPVFPMIFIGVTIFALDTIGHELQALYGTSAGRGGL